MNLYAIPNLACALACFVIGAFVLTKNYRSPVNMTFTLLALSMFTWQLGTALLLISVTPETAYRWSQVSYVGVIFIPVTAYHFITTSAREERAHKKIIWLSYSVAALIFLPLSQTRYLLEGVHHYTWGYWFKAGSLHSSFPVFFVVLMFMGLQFLYRGFQREISGSERTRRRYLFIAIAISCIGSVDFLPDYGFSFYPFGYLPVFTCISILAYAIVRHQLMDIEVIIRRTLVFAGLTGSVVGIVSLVAFISQDVLGGFIGISRGWSNIFAAIIIAAVYGRMRQWLVNVTDRYLFQKPYDYRELLRHFTNEVVMVLDLRKLVEMTAETLHQTMKLESCGLWLLNRVTNRYELTASKGLAGTATAVDGKDPLIEFLHTTQEPVVRDFIQKGGNHGMEVLEEELVRLKAEVCLPLAMRDEMVGIITLGKKRSDEPYAQEDIEILMALANTEAIAISNALLAAEAAQKEKLAVIGTLAAAINHEVCNPLNNIKVQAEGFLLQLQRGFMKDLSREDLENKISSLMQVTMQEIDRTASITTRLSNFAKPLREPVSEPVDVGKVVDEVLSLLGHDLELREIAVEKIVSPETPPLLVDHRQLQEILFNLVRNAGQAIGQKGKVTISTRVNGNGRVAIEIADTGSGVPPETLQRLFTPFFTTKGEGKGTGLGLFVIKRLVERNEGTISVKSEVGAGTTFTVEFPRASNRPGISSKAA